MKRRCAWWLIIGLWSCGSDAALGAPDREPNDDGGTDAVRTESGTADSDDATPRCAAEWEMLLKPIDLVSTGEVVVITDAPGKRTLYVDASAGGTQAASNHPRLYLSLESASKIDVTDRSAAASREWDLALKRPILFANSGDGGPGQGGAVFLAGREFDSVGQNDATGRTFAHESFFDASCAPMLDATGAVRTLFDEWYDYDSSNNTLSPKPGTWLVKGGSGKIYKVRIFSYYATPDGGTGQASGRYTLEVGTL